MTLLDLRSVLDEATVVPIFSRRDPAEAGAVATAVAKAGGRVLEFTNREPDALATFAHLAGDLAERHPGLELGAGTVFDAATAIEFIARGAGFIVSPAFDDATREACVERGVPYVPGCFTATEIRRAVEAGCAVVKLFPAAPTGTGYLRALRSVFPDVGFLPTGGIAADARTVEKWINAGALAVGLGSDLIPKEGASLEGVEEALAPLVRLRTEA